jgi:hypothetical protein
MKRLSLLLALSFVLLSFGLANAQSVISFSVSVEKAGGGSATFIHPADLNEYYLGNTPVKMILSMGNNGADQAGYSQTHKFYAASDITGATEVAGNVTWNDGGGAAQAWDNPEGSIVGLNGWEDKSTYYGLINEIVVHSWDGNLPDTVNHTTASTTGWPSGDPELPRFEFYFSVATSSPDPGNEVFICIDSSNGWNSTYDWLFPEETDFEGPYCFAFLTVPNLPPEIDNPTTAMSTPHDVPFSFNGNMSDPEGDPITGVVALDESSAPIGTVTFTPGTTTFSWSFDPPCSWVTDGLSHTVTFYPEDDAHGHTAPGGNGYLASLEATNSAPVISGPCGETIVAGITQLKIANFSATDANVGDSKTWSYEVRDNSDAPVVPIGSVDLTDGVLSFTPDPLDETNVDNGDYTFTVRVTDCADEYDECDVTFHVISQLPFFIEIGNNIDDCAYLGQHSYVNVTQVQGSEHNLGFDFLIAYDNSALAFLGAFGNPDLFDPEGDYQWEYFTYRFVNNCGGSCPSGLLEVVGIADQNDGMHSPVSTLLPPDFVLFTMDFLITNDYTLECNFVPISFFWKDCSDNSIAMNYRSDPPLVVYQAISRDVFGFNGGPVLITNPTYGWPTYFGAQEECENDPNDGKGNVRFIDFFNGGIKICCSDDIDARGDINLNGVLNEIADAVVFTNYFIYGMSAFTINMEGQKAATDVNADGIPLSVADLVYLIRVIVGDVLPIPKLSPYTTEANFAQNGQLVTVDAELGAALFVLEGNADVQLAEGAAQMELKTGLVNGNTHALVYSLEQGQTFSGNILNTNGTLLSVESADYNGSALKTVLVPTTFSISNYPNPFNPVTNIEMALPVATNWNLTIYNVAGQKVTEFAGFAEAGITNVVWDASAAASGIYFYKVTTDEGSLTKKMVLLK